MLNVLYIPKVQESAYDWFKYPEMCGQWFAFQSLFSGLWGPPGRSLVAIDFQPKYLRKQRPQMSTHRLS